MTSREHRAQELLELWDAIKTSRSCRHVVDIQEHKDNLNGLANVIRLGLYAESAETNLETACDKFETEYIKVKDKLHKDLLHGLGTK